MWRPPRDPSRCRAELIIGDDHGDNHATMRCRLALGHAGPHIERFDRPDPDMAGAVSVTWERDERRGEVQQKWDESRKWARWARARGITGACRIGEKAPTEVRSQFYREVYWNEA